MCREGDCDAEETPAEIAATPGRETPYSREIPRLERLIIELLRAPELARVDFRSSATTVDASAFAARACDVEARRIYVVPRDRPPVGDACYQPVDRVRDGVVTLARDTLFVKHGIDVARLHSRALVVHEMVHATQDAANQRLEMRVAEAAAFTAQALVFRAYGRVWPDDLPGLREEADAREAPTPEAVARRPSLDVLARVADEAAQALLARGPGAELPFGQEQKLYDAIDRVPGYAGHGADPRDFDGIAPTTSITPRAHRPPSRR